MSLENDLKSTNPQQILQALIKLLNSVTPPEVLELDPAFYTEPNPHVFLAKYESLDGKTRPEKNPEIFQQWMQYIWVWLELIFIANQKAALNEIKARHEQVQNLILQNIGLTEENNEIKQISAVQAALMVPAVPDSVDRAIQEAALNEMPIMQSIDVMFKMLLQIIGTEHPTCPLSQIARDTLNKVANEINEEAPSETKFKEYFHLVLKSDAIPSAQRTVVEEVTRDLKMTSNMLYDTLPKLITTILNAYKTYYGEDKLEACYEQILEAAQGLVKDGSWAGLDGEGNEFVVAANMDYAIRLRRIFIAEKHSETLKDTLIRQCENTDTELSDKIIDDNKALYKHISQHYQHSRANNALEVLEKINDFGCNISKFLKDRNFIEAVAELHTEKEYISATFNNDLEITFLNILDDSIKTAELLIQVTKFSGSFKENGQIVKGALQNLLAVFEKYKNAIRDSSSAIKILDKDEVEHDATEYVIAYYEKILQDHSNLIKALPQLQLPSRIFGVLLHSYGMTHGVGHVRQDSGVFTQVWSILFEDLKSDPKLVNHTVYGILNGRKYYDISISEKRVVQKLIQSTSDGYQFQNAIYELFHKEKYHNLDKYKNNPDFALVIQELERIATALKHGDVIKKIIISNSEDPLHVEEMVSFQQIFRSKYKPILISPLMEKSNDIKNYEAIITALIKTTLRRELEEQYLIEEAQQITNLRDILHIEVIEQIESLIEPLDRNNYRSDFLNKYPGIELYVKSVLINPMVGYSDSARVSGPGALITVQQVQEELRRIVEKDFALNLRVFHGAGGDNSRGGLKRRDDEATLQGDARSHTLATAESAAWYRQTQFYHAFRLKANPELLMEFSSLPTQIQNMIHQCETYSAEIYERLHDTKNGFGQILGFYLGRGAFFMAKILNAASRNTERGISDTRDRTSAVQTNGLRPEPYIHPEKPRAITAAQIKEILRDYIDLLIGPGYALRKLGMKNAIRIYDSSATVRDIFNKVTVAIAMSDYAVTSYALFADNPEFVPADRAGRVAMADEFISTYAALLQKMDIKSGIKTEAGKKVAVLIMSKMFAYIQEEVEQTKEFIFEMAQRIYLAQYRSAGAPKTMCEPTDILYHLPVLQAQIKAIVHRLKPVSYTLARQTYYVAQGKNLDQVYLGLNGERVGSNLSGTGRMLAAMANATAASRTMQPGFTETIYLDLRKDTRASVLRIESDISNIDTFYKQSNNASGGFAIFDNNREPRNGFEPEIGFNAVKNRYDKFSTDDGALKLPSADERNEIIARTVFKA